MNLNQRIAGYGRKLSKTERLLVDEMLARYPQSLLESATALARAVGTSASTVVRLLAKLGYDSYAQAQTERARKSPPGWPRRRARRRHGRRRPRCARLPAQRAAA